MIILYEDTTLDNKIREMRFFALSDLCNVMKKYCGYGFEAELLTPICTKKINFIKEIISKAEVKQILSFSKPSFNGNIYVGRKYHIPEEKLMMWSLTSLEAPLKWKWL